MSEYDAIQGTGTGTAVLGAIAIVMLGNPGPTARYVVAILIDSLQYSAFGPMAGGMSRHIAGHCGGTPDTDAAIKAERQYQDATQQGCEPEQAESRPYDYLGTS